MKRKGFLKETINALEEVLESKGLSEDFSIDGKVESKKRKDEKKMDKKIILKIIDLSGQTLKYDITSLRDKNNEAIDDIISENEDDYLTILHDYFIEHIAAPLYERVIDENLVQVRLEDTPGRLIEQRFTDDFNALTDEDYAQIVVSKLKEAYEGFDFYAKQYKVNSEMKECLVMNPIASEEQTGVSILPINLYEDYKLDLNFNRAFANVHNAVMEELVNHDNEITSDRKLKAQMFLSGTSPITMDDRLISIDPNIYITLGVKLKDNFIGLSLEDINQYKLSSLTDSMEVINEAIKQTQYSLNTLNNEVCVLQGESVLLHPSVRRNLEDIMKCSSIVILPAQEMSNTYIVNPATPELIKMNIKTNENDIDYRQSCNLKQTPLVNEVLCMDLDDRRFTRATEYLQSLEAPDQTISNEDDYDIEEPNDVDNVDLD